ncbi:NAD(P)/FAD-dependent oxidoreductase [Aquimarina macrocephali]|uniref:NAD(P)/FAD-dependent oxidoreductase n=1 Tax=Aquimarina macrocephali TaxID=666563 RepID=UPI003F674026
MTHKEYDIIIMGGGPSGSILGALLTKKSNLKVAIFEEDEFPREKIGESFAHPIIPILEECGVLQKVLDSGCWIKKFGGIFDWDNKTPKTTFFDMLNYVEDGVHRWAIHTDRAEFDKILLDHAQSSGVDVFEKNKIEEYRYENNIGTVTLESGQTLNCKIFVDASGRRNTVIPTTRKSYLSEYKNLAVWNHFVGGKPAQTLDGDWNIFKENNQSPVACFAFEHGWIWYIPIPKMINNERTIVYSLGIITDPKLIKTLNKDLKDPEQFFDFIKTVPRLKDLIKDAKPVNDEVKVLSNYSMIQEKFCDFDEGWIMVGDSAYFVDPLFSSGVAFAGGMASTASLLIRSTLDDKNLTYEMKKDVWHDYDEEWHKIAHSFALSIDQWYHAIAKSNPQSIFWNKRNVLTSDLGIKDETFHALVDTALNQDLLTLLTSGSFKKEDLDTDGRFLKRLSELNRSEPSPSDILSLDESVYIRDGFSIDVPGFKASIPPIEIPEELKKAIATYWKDPIKNGDAAPSGIEHLIPCSRFTKTGLDKNKEVRFVDQRTGGKALFDLLKQQPVLYSELIDKISMTQLTLLKNLILEGMVNVQKESLIEIK